MKMRVIGCRHFLLQKIGTADLGRLAIVRVRIKEPKNFSIWNIRAAMQAMTKVNCQGHTKFFGLARIKDTDGTSHMNRLKSGTGSARSAV